MRLIKIIFSEESEYIKIPWNIEDAKNLGLVLNRYKVDHYYHVMSGVFLSYILYPLINNDILLTLTV